MVQKKKKKQSKGRGVIYFVVLLCIICLTFEPITKALHINLPGTVTETVAEKAPGKQGQAVKKTSGKQQSAGKTSSKQKPATKVPATKVPAGKDILRPAPLKKLPNKFCTGRDIPYLTTKNGKYRIGWHGS